MNNFNFLSLILEIIKLLGYDIIFQAAVIKSLLQKFLWKSNFRNARKNTFYRRERALNFLFIASSHFGCNPLNLRFDIDFSSFNAISTISDENCLLMEIFHSSPFLGLSKRSLLINLAHSLNSFPFSSKVKHRNLIF